MRAQKQTNAEKYPCKKRFTLPVSIEEKRKSIFPQHLYSGTAFAAESMQAKKISGRKIHFIGAVSVDQLPEQNAVSGTQIQKTFRITAHQPDTYIPLQKSNQPVHPVPPLPFKSYRLHLTGNLHFFSGIVSDRKPAALNPHPSPAGQNTDTAGFIGKDFLIILHI